jgi:hypothetical protein
LVAINSFQIQQPSRVDFDRKHIERHYHQYIHTLFEFSKPHISLQSLVSLYLQCSRSIPTLTITIVTNKNHTARTHYFPQTKCNSLRISITLYLKESEQLWLCIVLKRNITHHLLKIHRISHTFWDTVLSTIWVETKVIPLPCLSLW